MSKQNMKLKFYSMFVIGIFLLSGLLLLFVSTPMTPTTKAASSWMQESISDFNLGTLDNVVIEGSGSEAVLELEYEYKPKWLQKFSSTQPSPRDAMGFSEFYGMDKVLLFGGYNGGFLGQTWIYDSGSYTWTQKSPASAPTARRSLGMASLYGDDKVLLYGGATGMSTYSAETWIYDHSADTWTKKTLSPNPGPLSGYGIASIWGDDKVVLWGGYSGSGWPTSTWVYDLSLDGWTLKTPKNKPSSRELSAMATIYGTDKVLLFGGRRSSTYGDTWIYDLSDDNWTKIITPESPIARSKHGLASIHGTDKVVLFGGTGMRQDTWVYDLSDNEWSEYTIFENPKDRYCPGMAGIYGMSRLIIFGGWGYTYFDDTWEFWMPSYKTSGTFTSAPFDTGARSNFQTINWSANTPADTDIKFQIRTAETKSALSSKEFMGPEGNTSRFYSLTNKTIWSSHDGDRWVQYKAFLSTSDSFETPSLSNVTISYNCYPDIELIYPSNGIILTNNRPTFFWSFNDQDSGVQTGFQVVIDNEINFTSIDFDSGKQSSSIQFWRFGEGTGYSTLPDGTWYWKVRTNDSDGDWGEYCSPMILTIDTKQPYSSPILPANSGYYNELTTITGEAIDPLSGTGLDIIEIIIKRMEDNYYWDGLDWYQGQSWLVVSGTTDWTYDASYITWSSGGQYTVQSRAIDNAGNIEIPSSGNVFIFDTDKPVSIIENPKHNAYINNLDIISGRAEDVGGSGISTIEISIERLSDGEYWDGTNWIIGTYWLPSNGTGPWFNEVGDVDWTTGSKYNVSCRAIDNGGNIEPNGLASTFMYDNEAPNQLSISINDDSNYTNSPDVTLSLDAVDAASGIHEMTFSLDGIGWTAWEPFAAEKVFTLSPKDGEKSVHYKVMDKASNIAEPVIDTIIMDTTSPEELSIEINDNAKYTNSITATLKLNAIDSLSGIKEMSFSDNAINWTSWETFDDKKLLNLTEGDGEKTIHFRVRDNADNFAQISDGIILDTVPPHSLSISINDGVTETNSKSVTLKLNAIDDLSGINQMSFSSDGETWTSSEIFTEVKYYTLSSGDGDKTIYFRVSDNAGNLANPISATIELNTSDIDGDGVANDNDDFPNNPYEWLDTDGDLIGDNGDPDDDNDGYPDDWEKALSTDSKDENSKPTDSDGDGLPDGNENNDKWWMDWDDDNDGYYDIREIDEGTDPLDSNDYPSDKETKSDDFGSMLPIYLLLVVIVIILVLILIFAVLRRKPAEDERPSAAEETGAEPEEPGEDSGVGGGGWKLEDEIEESKAGADNDWKVEDEPSKGKAKGKIPAQKKMPNQNSPLDDDWSIGDEVTTGEIKGKGKLPKKPGKVVARPPSAEKPKKVSKEKILKPDTDLDQPGRGKPKLHTMDKIVKCNICFGNVKMGLNVVTCVCGKHYHQNCAVRVDTCPVCDVSLKELEDLTGKDE